MQMEMPDQISAYLPVCEPAHFSRGPSLAQLMREGPCQTIRAAALEAALTAQARAPPSCPRSCHAGTKGTLKATAVLCRCALPGRVQPPV
eukprot:935265-Pleurochrysis_carterae.AAC.2